MLQIEGLTKQFGSFTAVDNISFSVNRGEVLGFLGPNGAGKTTAMRMVSGFLTPTSGTAYVGGHDVTTAPLEVKRRIGYLPEGAPLYEDMTPSELLAFISDVRGLSGGTKRETISTAASRINIEHVMHQAIGTLSKGYKRRVGIAQAILHDPEILILDEPTDGLDPNQKHEVRKLINEMAKDKVIVISTHLLDEVDTVCSRAIVIAQGKIVADGTPADLEAQSELHNAVTLRLAAAQSDKAKGTIEAVAGVDRVVESEAADNFINITAYPKSGEIVIDDVSAALKAAKIDVQEIQAERGRLDEVFRRLTTAA
ncbi:MAG: ATP-binding cassette domain-containing protein [Alphaproteobacteria bacterium]|nr:ATP-binding cassette domain-containing protein [Alphaproteobacteria bacterium]